jgi:hypothetical protein
METEGENMEKLLPTSLTVSCLEQFIVNTNSVV